MTNLFDECCPEPENQKSDSLGFDNMTAIIVEVGLYNYRKLPGAQVPDSEEEKKTATANDKKKAVSPKGNNKPRVSPKHQKNTGI